MDNTDMKGLGARLAPWIATAGVAGVALWLTGRVIALQSENESLRTERLLAEVAYKEGQAQLAERSLLAEKMINSLAGKLRRAENLARLKVSVLASPAGSSPEARAIAVWDPDQPAGWLDTAQLPPNTADQDYQVWVVDPARPDPVDCGVFHAGAGARPVFVFKPSHPVTQITGFVLSLEKAGGATKMEGPVVLHGK